MSKPESADPWILRPRPRPAARLRLLCIPHAGGGASAFRGWADLFPESIEVCPVQLPGREQRIREAPFDRLEPLVEALAGAVLRRAEVPFAIFGHSNGALIGYELARLLRRRGERGPVHLVASGRRAPHVPPPPPLTMGLPDDQFLDELARLGGMPAEVREHPELREMLLPVLRADVALHETYEYQDEPPLEIPITGYAGMDDPRAPPDTVAEWAVHTSREFALRTWPGGHFYLAAERDRVIRQVVQDLGI